MDGLCAAWVALTALRREGWRDDEIKTIPAHYNNPLPELDLHRGDNVYIVDFSYPRDVLIELSKRCNLTVLDHHDTAAKSLVGMDTGEFGNIIFDMEKSGAGLAWWWFFGDVPVPSIVQMVQDRDLWLFHLPDTKAFSAVLQNHPSRFDFVFWDEMLGLYDFSKDQRYIPEEIDKVIPKNHPKQTKLVDEMIAKGRIILEQIDGQLTNFLDRKHYKIINWHDYRVALFNTTVLMSELGEVAYQKIDVDFSMSYFINQDGRVIFSLRSLKNGPVHVGKIALEHGGGGHQPAAGFSYDGIKGMKFLSDLYLS